MGHLLSESHNYRMTKVLQEIAVSHSEQLMEKARNGDERSFNKLVGVWFNPIYGFCMKYFDDHDRAMESTQKTFIALHRHLGNIRDNGSLKFWLYKVARNQCYEEGRRMARRPWLSIFQNKEVEQKGDGYYHPERKIYGKEKESWVAALLQKIPAEQREVIIMKEYEELKFQEIADMLGISVNTAKSRLYYGLSNLRKQIENSGYKYREEL